MSSGAVTTFHSRIKQDSIYPPETNRYYLFSAKSCPFAHRVEIIRNLKSLDNFVKIVYADPAFRFSGWVLDYKYDGSDISPVPECKTLKDLYLLASPGYEGRCTLPVLYDSKTKTIVNNESIEIIEIFNSDFNILTNKTDFNPKELRQQIDIFCAEFGKEISTGTYVVGHAKSKDIYMLNLNAVFSYLDKLDAMLTGTYIFGDSITLADVVVFAHLIRFDCLFYELFHCNKKRLSDYKNISQYMGRLMANTAFADTVDFESIVVGGTNCENNSVEYLCCRAIGCKKHGR